MTRQWEEAEEILKSLDGDVEMVRLANGSYYGREIYELSDGAQLVLEFEDRAENQASVIQTSVTQAVLPLATSSETMWESYGSRCFTATGTVSIDNNMVSLVLSNYYELSSSGIKEKYGTASYNKTGVVTVKTLGPYILNNSTSYVGGYVNMYSNYDIKIESNGFEKSCKLTSYIDYMAHNSSTKQIQVKHRLSIS